MKGIFKLYIFKLVILSLTMIFISFGASAYSIKTMYEYCKPLQNNGFKMKGLDEERQVNGLTCSTYTIALKELGERNCIYLNIVKEMGADDKSGTFDMFSMVKNTMASGKADVNAVVASFNKFAENNPDKWENKPSVHFKEFVSEVFPCKLDN